MLSVLRRQKHELLFRLGLSGIFLANSLVAWFLPDEFKDLVVGSNLATLLGTPSFLTHVIGVNDVLLFLLILSGKWRHLVALWAVVWLFGVIIVTGVYTPDFIEHVSIMFLIGYYFFSASKKVWVNG